MGSFDNELDVLTAETNRLVVVQERPHYVTGSAFVIFGVCLLVAGIRKWHGEWSILLVILGAALWQIGLGSLALVRSVIALDTSAGTLRVERRALGIKIIEQQFQLGSIERVVVRNTIKGSGLGLELKDRKRKTLTLFVGYRSLADIAANMNQLIHAKRRRT